MPRNKKPFYEKPFEPEDEMGSSSDIFSSEQAMYEAERESLQAEEHSRPAFRPENEDRHQEQDRDKGPPYRSISSGIQKKDHSHDREEGTTEPQLGPDEGFDVMEESEKEIKKPLRKKTARKKTQKRKAA